MMGQQDLSLLFLELKQPNFYQYVYIYKYY